MKRSLCLLALIFALSVQMPLQAARVINEPMTPKPFAPMGWQNVLMQALDQQGNVAFDRLKAQPRRINGFMDQLQAVSPDNHPEYFETPADVLAYWLNAYNALSLKLILDKYPIDSVAQVPNMMEDKRYSFGGIPMSLSMLQEKIQEQAVNQGALVSKALFAVTLYSEDSPPLLPQAFQGSTLKQQLDLQMKRVMGDARYVRVAQGDYGLNPANTCAVLRLSPWFAQVREGLELSATGKAGGATGTKAATAKVLFDVVKPYLLSEDYARMMVRCAHGIGYLPPNPALRKAESVYAPKK